MSVGDFTEGGINTTPPLSEHYHGTIRPLTFGTVVGPEMFQRCAGEEVLDAGRSPSAGLRSRAVWAAATIKEATAIAAIRAYTPSTPIPHSAIRVYKVRLGCFHTAPVAVITQICARLKGGGTVEGLVREYWAPTGQWFLNEMLAPELTILDEVPAASERDTYLSRWVHYNEDCERAQFL